MEDYRKIFHIVLKNLHLKNVINLPYIQLYYMEFYIKRGCGVG